MLHLGPRKGRGPYLAAKCWGKRPDSLNPIFFYYFFWYFRAQRNPPRKRKESNKKGGRCGATFVERLGHPHSACWDLSNKALGRVPVRLSARPACPAVSPKRDRGA